MASIIASAILCAEVSVEYLLLLMWNRTEKK